MKTKIFILFIVLPFTCFAQYYKSNTNTIFLQNYEIGIGGGASINSEPIGNESYKGNIIIPNYASNLTLLTNLQHNWQVGLDIHALELSSKSSSDFPQLYSAEPGGKGMKFIYGEVTSSLCAAINKKINTPTGYFYAGAEAGLGIERDANSKNPTGNVYYIEPDGGYGPVLGLHTGYTRNITGNIALNAEFAALYYDVYNKAQAPLIKPYNTLHYSIESFPLTVGIRYRFDKKKAPVKSNNPGKTILPAAAASPKYEIGIGGGLSINSKPTQNEFYRGNIILPNYASNLTLLRNFRDNWQMGIDIHVLELSRSSSYNFPKLYASETGGTEMKFIYGEITSSLCATVNKKIITPTGYFYLGAEAGLGVERDAHSTHPTGNVYYIEPDGGYGLVYGPHAGYTRNLTERIALNAEFAALVYDVTNNAEAPLIKPYTNLHYRIDAFPLTVGIHYSFDNLKEAFSISNKSSGLIQNYEIGIGGGVSINSRPYGNEFYKGDIVTPNYASNLTLVANLQSNWQVGVEYHALELSRKSSVDFPQLYSIAPGGKGREFIYGEVTSSFCGTINKKITTPTGYFYAGAEAGFGIENDHDSRHPTGNVYYLEPDGGNGFVYGPHVGYTRNISERISLNAELAALIYYVDNKAEAPLVTPYSTLHYNITAYPLTIGIHYKLGNLKEATDNSNNLHIATQNYEIGIGGGVSINSNPTGNESYKGGIIIPNYASNFTLLANLQSNWQVGLDYHALELSRKSSVDFPQLYSTAPGGKGMKFIYGEVASSFCATINKKIITPTGYFYIGAEAGLGIESDAHSTHPTGNVYYMEPDGGYGLVYGPHAGYTRNITERIALNAEMAALFYDVKNTAEAPLIKPSTPLHYEIESFPLTIGIRYRFGNLKETTVKPNTSLGK